MAESEEELKRLLLRVHKDSEKAGLKLAGLKLNIQKTKIRFHLVHLVPSLHGK